MFSPSRERESLTTNINLTFADYSLELQVHWPDRRGSLPCLPLVEQPVTQAARQVFLKTPGE
jgi:hypothetical protein